MITVRPMQKQVCGEPNLIAWFVPRSRTHLALDALSLPPTARNVLSRFTPDWTNSARGHPKPMAAIAVYGISCPSSSELLAAARIWACTCRKRARASCLGPASLGRRRPAKQPAVPKGARDHGTSGLGCFCCSGFGGLCFTLPRVARTFPERRPTRSASPSSVTVSSLRS